MCVFACACVVCAYVRARVCVSVCVSVRQCASVSLAVLVDVVSRMQDVNLSQ